MAGKLSKLRPNASSTVHLVAAASLWTVVGLSLILRGTVWLIAIDRLWIIVPGLVVGTLKSFLVLDRSAKKNITRILSSRDGKCIGGMFSLQTWLLVLVMMTSGIILRNSSLPKEFLGLFYVAIGWALVFSSRNAWIAWKEKVAAGSKSDDNKTP